MPARMMRQELLDSDRWLGLTHPVERLAYVVLLLHADDLGCADASSGALVRRWREPCLTKSTKEAEDILDALVRVDLVRVYESGGKRFLFIPRFKQRFRAKAFKRPPPPPEMLVDEPHVMENIKEIQQSIRKNASKAPSDVGTAPTNDGLDVVVDVKESRSAASSKNGTRLPDDWEPDPTLFAWAAAERPDLHLPNIIASFRDYWLSKTGRDATKRDWAATFRNWIRNEKRGPATPAPRAIF